MNEKYLMEIGFVREYPIYRNGDITVIAYDDEDRIDIFYLVNADGSQERIRTKEQFEKLINGNKTDNTPCR